MKRNFSFALALGALSFTTTAIAQQSAPSDAARQESVVQQAMRTYQSGLEAIDAGAAARSPAPPRVTCARFALEEAVTLALEKNLDIQVAKLEPQSVDFQIAGVPQHAIARRLARRSACAISTSCRRRA